jgi:hypothetical protein
LRYLYGDSAPFPLRYNFLSTLESFVGSAAIALALDAESRSLHTTASTAAVGRSKSIDELERFHVFMMQGLREGAARTGDQFTSEYARIMGEHATRHVEVARTLISQQNERELASVRLEVDRRKIDIRGSMETFFRVAKLPLLESRVTLGLVTDGREPRNVLSTISIIPEGIVAGFSLSIESLEDWKRPRRVSEFAQGVDLMVGARKSWFSKKVEPEILHLDDYFVGGFEISDDAAEIRLRKKADQPDALIFNVRKVDGELVAEIHRPEDPDVDGQLPSRVDAGDLVQLERLWQLLRTSSSSVLDRKEHVISIHLDGEDVFEGGLVVPLVERIIRILAPTLAEIDRRSPNASELSLKTETDAGHREEIYLNKDDLIRKLMALPPEERERFAPLGLERPQT